MTVSMLSEIADFLLEILALQRYLETWEQLSPFPHHFLLGFLQLFKGLVRRLSNLNFI